MKAVIEVKTAEIEGFFVGMPGLTITGSQGADQ